jgi:hypothetical protein
MLPTNASVLSDAKSAILGGDRTRALALLDGLRERPVGEVKVLSPGMADALVATARGDDGLGRECDLRESRTALRRIVDWISRLAVDVEDLTQISAAVSTRQSVRDATTEQQEQLDSSGEAMRVFGGGWLEWRWVDKPSGRRFGPYVYYRWREGGGSERNTLPRSASPDLRVVVRYQLANSRWRG